MCENFVWDGYSVEFSPDGSWCIVYNSSGSWQDTLVLTDYGSCQDKQNVIISVIDNY